MRVAKHTTPPASLNIKKMVDYYGARKFKQDKKTGVWAYMGQLYSDSGKRLPHDPEFLVKNGYTLVKEMADIITQRPKEETKTCHSCAFNKLSAADRFCKNCGTKVHTPEVILQDDTLIKFLQNLDGENPFALLREFQPRDERAPSPRDFMTREDVEAIIQESNLGGSLPSVPGEMSVVGRPKLDIKVNPYASVEFTRG